MIAVDTILLDTLKDTRYALRILIRNPAFLFFALLSMALGIGAATAVFSMVDGVLLRPLPYPNAQRLMTIWETEPQLNLAPVTLQDFLAWQRQNSVFTDLSAYDMTPLTISGSHGASHNPERVLTARVSAELFRMLDIAPLLGRALAPADGRAVASPSAVISERLWRTRFGADPRVIGRPIHLDRKIYIIAGVMPARFESPLKNSDVWIPLVAETELSQASHYLRIVARLKDGVRMETAQAEMNVIAARLAAQFPETNTGVGARIVPLLDLLHEEIGPMLRVLSGGAALLLLIASVNLSGLLLARSINRQHEICVRLAVGASRARLVRQLLIESMVLSLAGGLGGILAAPSLIRWLLALFPERISAYVPNLENISVNGHVLAVAILTSAAIGLLFGLMPAWKASRMNVRSQLNAASFRNTGTRAQGRTGSALVMAEFAVSVILLAAAGLLFRSFFLLEHRELGFAPDHVLAFSVSLPEAAYPADRDAARFSRQLIGRVEAISSVRCAAAISNLPLGGSDSDAPIRLAGTPKPRDGQETLAEYSAATPGYFRAMGIRLLAGREFEPGDEKGRPEVAVIGESTARLLFADGKPLGKTILLGADNEAFEVVGVVRDVRWNEMDNEKVTSLYVYLPFAQQPQRAFSVVLRTSVPPAHVAAEVRAAMSRVDPEQPISHLATMDELVARANAPRRFNVLLMGAFALFALLLANAGVYGAMTHSVSSRRREIGIRLALGANRSSLARRFLGEALRLAGVGGVAGLAAAGILARAMASLLYGVKPDDPIALGSSLGILLFTAILAGAIPIVRALCLQPAEVLSEERL